MTEKIGLEAVLADEQFQAASENYLRSVHDMESTTDRAAGALSSTWSSAGVAVAAGIGVITAAVGAFVAASSKGLSELEGWAGQLDTLGDQFGLSGEQASGWAYLMNRVGVSVEEGAGGLNYFVRSLAQSEDALQKASSTYASSAGEITRAHNDALAKLQGDAVQAEADAAEKRLDIAEKLAERKQEIEENLAETIADINADLSKRLAEYAYDRAHQEEEFNKDAAKIDQDAAKARLDVEEQFQEDLVDLRRDRARDLEAVQQDLVDTLNDIDRDRAKSLDDLEKDSSKSLADLERNTARSLEKLEKDRLRDLADVDKDAAAGLADLQAQRDRRLLNARTYAQQQAIEQEYAAEVQAIKDRTEARKKEIEERAAERRAEIEEAAAERQAEIAERAQERRQEIEARAKERKEEAEQQAAERRKQIQERARERRKELAEARADRLKDIEAQRRERAVDLAERRAEANREYEHRLDLARQESAARIEEAQKAAAKQEALAERTSAREQEAVEKSLAKQADARQKRFEEENQRFDEQMAKLRANLNGASSSSPLLKALDALGISLYDDNGHLREFNDIMPEILDKFSQLPEGIEASNIAMQLFGRNGSKFLDFLRQGSEGLAGAMKRAQELGLVLSGDTVKDVEDFQFAWNELNLGLTGFWVQVGKYVLPIASDLVGFINTKALPAFIGWVRDFKPVVDTVGSFAQKVKAGDFDGAVGMIIGGLLDIAGLPDSAAEKMAWHLVDEFYKARTGIENFWRDAQDPLSEFETWLKTEGPAALDTFYDKVGEFDPVVNKWGQALDRMWALFKLKTDNIEGDAAIKFPHLADIVGFSMDRASTVWSNQLDFILKTWELAGDVLTFKFGKVFMEDIPNTVDAGMKLALSYIGLDLDQMQEDVRIRFIQAQAIITEQVEGFRDAGRQVIQGLIDGFWDQEQQVEQALYDIIQGAIDRIREILGIHSPSTVFEEIGANMALGLVEGFGKPQLDVGSALAGGSRQMFSPGAYSPRFEIPAQVMAIPPTAGAASSLQPITINFNGSGGPVSRQDALEKGGWMVEALRQKGIGPKV